VLSSERQILDKIPTPWPEGTVLVSSGKEHGLNDLEVVKALVDCDGYYCIGSVKFPNGAIHHMERGLRRGGATDYEREHSPAGHCTFDQGYITHIFREHYTTDKLTLFDIKTADSLKAENFQKE
jgi:hypothetical protein